MSSVLFRYLKKKIFILIIRDECNPFLNENSYEKKHCTSCSLSNNVMTRIQCKSKQNKNIIVPFVENVK